MDAFPRHIVIPAILLFSSLVVALALNVFAFRNIETLIFCPISSLSMLSLSVVTRGLRSGRLVHLAIKWIIRSLALLLGLAAVFALHYATTTGNMEEGGKRVKENTSTFLYANKQCCYGSRGNYMAQYGTILEFTGFVISKRASNEPMTFVLPFGVVIAFVQGTPLDTVVRSKECRTAALAYCSYILLICCTVVAAAAAACLDLVALESTQSYLLILSFFSLAQCLPLLCFPVLHSPGYIRRICSFHLPLTATVFFLLQATGFAELSVYESVEESVELLRYTAIYATMAAVFYGNNDQRDGEE